MVADADAVLAGQAAVDHGLARSRGQPPLREGPGTAEAIGPGPDKPREQLAVVQLHDGVAVEHRVDPTHARLGRHRGHHVQGETELSTSTVRVPASTTNRSAPTLSG